MASTEEDLKPVVFEWLDHVVIGRNFCPFARAVRQRDRIRLLVSPSAEPADALQDLSDAATLLCQGHADDTLLFLLPRGFEEFDDFLDLLAIAEVLLVDLGYEGVLQIASFHPEYRFADADAEHVGNWTNRSPVPILHLLQEGSVARQIERHPNINQIPARNIDVLESMDATDLDNLKRWCIGRTPE